LSVLEEFLSFVYTSVRVIRHHLIRQFGQYVTFFYPLEVFCLTTISFAVLLLISKQLVHVGIQTNLYLRIVAPRNLFIEFIHEVQSATQLPTERM